jgi:hypothetical protein
MDKIIRAKDYAQREGAKSVVERIARISAQLAHRRLLDTPFVGGAPVGTPVLAEVNHGQWMAFCECGGAEAVDADEPIFYCFNCGNHATKGRPRPVTFPQQRVIEEIEQALLERPLDEGGGANEIDRVFLARPLVGVVEGAPVVMHRSWKPGETVEELMRQNGMIPALKKMKDESEKMKAEDSDPPSPALPKNGRAQLGEGSDSEEAQ